MKGDEFDSNILSNAVANFFHIFVIVLHAECEKKLATAFDIVSLLTSFGFTKK